MPIVHERYIRARNFKPAEYGASRWWLLSLSQDGATAQGVEIIEIEEIVETVTLGRLAIFRRWITDPNGQSSPASTFPNAARFSSATNSGCVATSKPWRSNGSRPAAQPGSRVPPCSCKCTHRVPPDPRGTSLSAVILLLSFGHTCATRQAAPPQRGVPRCTWRNVSNRTAAARKRRARSPTAHNSGHTCATASVTAGAIRSNADDAMESWKLRRDASSRVQVFHARDRRENLAGEFVNARARRASVVKPRKCSNGGLAAWSRLPMVFPGQAPAAAPRTTSKA